MAQVAEEDSVTETMNSAKEYMSKLEELMKSIEAAENQVELSAAQSTVDVETAFKDLSEFVLGTLNKRRDALLEEISSVRKAGLAPLKACSDLIKSKLYNVKTYVAEGGDILKVKGLALSESTEFCEKASFLGCLPEVPHLQEVPYVSLQCNIDSLKNSLALSIQGFGHISRMGRVQIIQMDERPGALLVHWEEVDFEHNVDISKFRLQYAYGDIRNQPHLFSSNFHDVYIGFDTQHLVRDLRPATPYTFRVCCLIEGETEWSAWSLPRVGSSNIPPFSWALNNPHYIITNEGKIACKSTLEPSLLLSCAAQLGPEHCIDFTILECGADCDSEQGLGLISGPPRVDGTLVQTGTVFVSISGHVYVDGVEKMMRLPPLTANSKVFFLCSHINDNKLRVQIGTADKTVIYDWTPICDTESDRPTNLFFALNFITKGWKVLVE